MLKAGTAARRRSQTWETDQAPTAVREQIEGLLRDIDTLLQQSHGDWVGHVKILIATSAETTYGSLTTANDTPRWSGTLTTPINKAELTIYAAIYTLTDGQVAAAVDEALAAANLPATV